MCKTESALATKTYHVNPNKLETPIFEFSIKISQKTDFWINFKINFLDIETLEKQFIFEWKLIQTWTNFQVWMMIFNILISRKKNYPKPRDLIFSYQFPTTTNLWKIDLNQSKLIPQNFPKITFETSNRINNIKREQLETVSVTLSTFLGMRGALSKIICPIGITFLGRGGGGVGELKKRLKTFKQKK